MLKNQIIAAFAMCKKDPEQTLHQAQYTDNGMSDDFSSAQWRLEAKKDADKHWQEIPEAALIECDAALSHATLQNWRYFLAAHLCFALDAVARHDFDYELIDRVICHSPYHSPDEECESGVENTFYLERFNTLTLSQIDAIKSFLAFCVAESLKEIEASNCYVRLYDAAQKALASYWQKPAS